MEVWDKKQLITYLYSDASSIFCCFTCSSNVQSDLVRPWTANFRSTKEEERLLIITMPETFTTGRSHIQIIRCNEDKIWNTGRRLYFLYLLNFYIKPRWHALSKNLNSWVGLVFCWWRNVNSASCLNRLREWSSSGKRVSVRRKNGSWLDGTNHTSRIADYVSQILSHEHLSSFTYHTFFLVGEPFHFQKKSSFVFHLWIYLQLNVVAKSIVR